MIKNKTIYVNIGYLSNGEILGLDNMIYEGKYFCSAKCVSEKCEFFSLQKKFFDDIIFKFSFLQKNMHKFMLLKKEFMYQTFLKVKNNLIKNAQINFNYLYRQPTSVKNIFSNNLKILTNISLNLYQNYNNNKPLLKNKKLKLNSISKSINKYFLSSENRKNKLNDLSFSESSLNSLDKKESLNKSNSSSSIIIKENNLNKKSINFYSPKKEILNFPNINLINRFYNNVSFGYQNKHVTLNKIKLKKINLKYLSLIPFSTNIKSQKIKKQKFLENKKYSSIFNKYDCLIYANINKEDEKLNYLYSPKKDSPRYNKMKMKKYKSQFITACEDDKYNKKVPLMYLLKPNYKLTKKYNLSNINNKEKINDIK